MYILPNDICRCHDTKCKLNTTCIRYIQRATTRTVSARYTAAATLKPPYATTCDNYINVEDC